MEEQNTPQAFTLRQFCAAYAVGRTFTYREIKRGQLIARKAGNRTLIMRVDADAWASKLPNMHGN